MRTASAFGSLSMTVNSIGRKVATFIYSAVYAFIGLIFGVTSGYIVTKVLELIFRTPLIFSGTGQLLVGIWAILLACLAVVAYLRSAPR